MVVIDNGVIVGTLTIDDLLEAVNELCNNKEIVTGNNRKKKNL